MLFISFASQKADIVYTLQYQQSRRLRLPDWDRGTTIFILILFLKPNQHTIMHDQWARTNLSRHDAAVFLKALS